MADTPTSRLRSAAQGYLELNGACHPCESGQLTAPLTGHDCVWYHYEIAKYVRSGKNSRWKTIEKQTSEEFFLLRDGTGRCFVNPADAEVHPLHESVWYGSARHPQSGPPTGKSWFRLHSGRYRYTERRMHVGDPLYALGYFETVRPTGLEQDMSVMLRSVIAEWKRDYDVLVDRFDADGDGQIDLKEWEAVRDAARLEAEAQRVEQHASPDVNVLATPPVGGHPFILSGHGEEAAARRYQIHASVSLIGFFVLGGIATMLGTECLTQFTGH